MGRWSTLFYGFNPDSLICTPTGRCTSCLSYGWRAGCSSECGTGSWMPMPGRIIRTNLCPNQLQRDEAQINNLKLFKSNLKSPSFPVADKHRIFDFFESQPKDLQSSGFRVSSLPFRPELRTIFFCSRKKSQSFGWSSSLSSWLSFFVTFFTRLKLQLSICNLSLWMRSSMRCSAIKI